MPTIFRRKTPTVRIGDVRVGSDAPVVVQSMTNTDTADVPSTVAAGGGAGARRLGDRPRHRQQRGGGGSGSRTSSSGWRAGVDVPIIGDFHYNGHLLLKKYPACARALAKYRINPGQRRHRAQGRRQFPHDGRSRGREPEAGAHRRELGFARSGSADADDGRERQARRAAATRAT